jgi:superfamily I DNA/RNA helicase
VPQLRWLAAIGADRPDALFFAGDLGQRIFQTPFSWLSLGVDVRGRSQTLRINYRTSHQIRQEADRLLPPELADVDGNAEERRGTISVFEGPAPTVRVLDSSDSETATIAAWLRERSGERFAPHEIGIFVRTDNEIDRALAAVEAAGLAACNLSDRVAGATGAVAVGTMHLAKGLEYRAVVVAACDDEILPLQARIEGISDPADLEEVYNTERHLLYVACTRARERLLVTGIKPASEFLDDLGAAAQEHV